MPVVVECTCLHIYKVTKYPERKIPKSVRIRTDKYVVGDNIFFLDYFFFKKHILRETKMEHIFRRPVTRFR